MKMDMAYLRVERLGSRPCRIAEEVNMAKKVTIGYLLLTLGVLFTACVSAKVALSPDARRPQGVAAPGAEKAAWEVKWESVLEGAKKEGELSLFTGWGVETRGVLSKAFKDRFGIEPQLLTFSRGSEVTARVIAQRNAGLHLVDVFGTGPITLLTSLKPDGLLRPMDSLLILPEVRDPKAWQAGGIPFVDDEKTGVGLVHSAQRDIIRNTELVKDGEITSYMDLLKPQYKGKIALDDPSTLGGGVALLTHLALGVWDVERARGFLKDLLVNQEVVIVRDRRSLVEWVGRGKYAIALGPPLDVVAEFAALGSPLAPVPVKEGTYTTTGGQSVGVYPNMPHPNATTVFVNWILSKEGQTVFSKAAGRPSVRVDVQAEGVLPLFFTLPGEKNYPETEKIFLFRGEMARIAGDLIATYSK